MRLADVRSHPIAWGNIVKLVLKSPKGSVQFVQLQLQLQLQSFSYVASPSTFGLITPILISWIKMIWSVNRLRAVSFFPRKSVGKNAKQTNLTVSVTWERRCLESLVAWALGDERKERLHWFHTTIWMLLWQVISMTPPPYFEYGTLVSLREFIEAISGKIW